MVDTKPLVHVYNTLLL